MRLIKVEVANSRGIKMAINVDQIVAIAHIEERGGLMSLNTSGIVTTTGNYIVKGTVDELVDWINRFVDRNPTVKDN